MAHDVFISYSTKDKIIADTVCAKLEESKIRAWIAPRDVPAGSNFAESIIRAINTCKVFVLVWSADTNTSQHILNEINQAFDRGLITYPGNGGVDGIHGDHVLLAPPFTITNEQIDEMVDILQQAIRAVQNQL